MQLDLEDLRLSLGGTEILRGMSLSELREYPLALIGPSGGGKSTLLRALAGLLIPDSGRILFEGEALPTQESLLIAHRRRLGVVFQGWNLFLHLDALRNITLPLTEVHGVSAEEADQRAWSLLKRFALAEHAHKKPRELSGGQQQRVALLRALALKPELLLLDEPTSALDPEMAAQVLEMVEQLKDEGTPVILVTHQLAFARQVAKEVLFLAEGQILERASAEAFFEQPQSPEAERFLHKVLRYG